MAYPPAVRIGASSVNLNRAHKQWTVGAQAIKAGHWDKALKAFRQAHQMAPQDSLYAINLARAQRHFHDFDGAIGTLQHLLAREPGEALAKRLLAECMAQQGDASAASECLLTMVSDRAEDLDYLEALTILLFDAGRYQECVRYTLKALQLKVDHAQSHHLLGVSLNELGVKKQAIECLRTALVLGYENGNGTANSLLALMERELCHWDEAQVHLDALRQDLLALPMEAPAWISVFATATLCDDPWMTWRAAIACSRFNGRHAQPLPPAPPMDVRGRKIRVGFVSADFHQHATTVLMAELIELMDHDRFEVFLYSHGPDDGSVMRSRIQRAADHFVDLRKVGDVHAARRVRDDAIDILVDLKGHTSGNRLSLFAWRPAPIQVSWLAFPGTTGASCIDYFIGDAVSSPLTHAADFTEKLALMPRCYQPNDRRRPLPATDQRARHGLPEKALVLCGFNQPFKISKEVFASWCRVLHRRPDAVLWLLAWNDEVEPVLRSEAARRGVDPSRLVFAPRVDLASHLSRFALADLFLDTWPCNGHTTASDALWAGVPVVTLAGDSFASRVAASLLTHVGQTELICTDVQSYEDTVLSLAADGPRRQALRDALVIARDQAPLFDSQQYATDFGQLLQRMVDRHVEGLPPDHLPAQL